MISRPPLSNRSNLNLPLTDLRQGPGRAGVLVGRIETVAGGATRQRVVLRRCEVK